MVLTYAIGDVHGRRDLLAALLAAIRSDAGSRPLRVIFLGDLIDRGPESRQCLDLVVKTLDQFPGSRLILGNHEEFLLRSIDPTGDREAAARRWLPNGGVATLRSYGLDETDPIDRVAVRLTRDFPSHVSALRQADWMVETDTHVFVHAGIEPDIALSEQDPETTRWIREQFLHHPGPFAKTVVHGHTITASALPELHPGRIAIDTGAVQSGRLTCVVFDGDAGVRFLATERRRDISHTLAVRPLDCR